MRFLSLQILLCLLCLFVATLFAADGAYTNPIIDADYSDPDVIRVGDDFYLTASSFNCVPGLPILHSRDLVNWKIIGHALQQQPPYDVFARPQHGNGVWAPAIRFHKGEFYIFYGDPDFGIYMVKARKAAGPWSQPLLIRPAKGWIDPAPFWDDDGNAYLVHAWANSRSGIKSILTINRLSPDGTKLLDDGQMIFDGRVNHPTIEGPKLYKRNGYYYIFAPAGGVSTGSHLIRVNSNKEEIVAQLKTSSVFLRVSVDNGICEFSYSTDGKTFHSAGEAFTAKPGMWIGAKVGLFSLAPETATKRGYADYDWFRFVLPERSSQTRARVQ